MQGTSLPFDWLPGSPGTSRGYDGDYGMMIGSDAIVTAPNAFAYYDAQCVPGAWYVGADGLRRFCP